MKYRKNIPRSNRRIACIQIVLYVAFLGSTFTACLLQERYYKSIEGRWRATDGTSEYFFEGPNGPYNQGYNKGYIEYNHFRRPLIWMISRGGCLHLRYEVNVPETDFIISEMDEHKLDLVPAKDNSALDGPHFKFYRVAK